MTSEFESYVIVEMNMTSATRNKMLVDSALMALFFLLPGADSVAVMTGEVEEIGNVAMPCSTVKYVPYDKPALSAYAMW